MTLYNGNVYTHITPYRYLLTLSTSPVAARKVFKLFPFNADKYDIIENMDAQAGERNKKKKNNFSIDWAELERGSFRGGNNT